MNQPRLFKPYAISTIVLAGISIAFWLFELQLLPTTNNFLDFGLYSGGVAVLFGVIAGIAAIAIAAAQQIKTHRITKLTVAALVIGIPALVLNLWVLQALGQITT